MLPAQTCCIAEHTFTAQFWHTSQDTPLCAACFPGKPSSLPWKEYQQYYQSSLFPCVTAFHNHWHVSCMAADQAKQLALGQHQGAPTSTI
eukprot:1161106-Pelagomonas_calceolata.AAC.4